MKIKFLGTQSSKAPNGVFVFPFEPLFIMEPWAKGETRELSDSQGGFLLHHHPLNFIKVERERAKTEKLEKSDVKIDVVDKSYSANYDDKKIG